MHQKKKMVVYGYDRNEIVWELQPACRLDMGKRMSPDFSEYLDVEEDECGKRIVEYKGVDLRKLYMHICHVGGVCRDLGNEIVRYVLKVVI